MSYRRPLIAISSTQRRISPSFIALWIAVLIAGGLPRRCRVNGGTLDTTFDGLILAGGPDVSPTLFGEHPVHRRRYELERDVLELRLLAGTDTPDLPVLGICRGAQLMNAAAGGTIHPAVHRAYKNARYPHHPLAFMLFRKRIFIAAGSLFATLAGKLQIMVNSIHRQSIDRVGDGYVVTAREKNGVIQVIENPDRVFCIGVQFHPELLLYRSTFRRLFRKLVAEAGRNHATNTEAGETC